jgi:hypothetical protein
MTLPPPRRCRGNRGSRGWWQHAGPLQRIHVCRQEGRFNGDSETLVQPGLAHKIDGRREVHYQQQ